MFIILKQSWSCSCLSYFIPIPKENDRFSCSCFNYFISIPKENDRFRCRVCVCVCLCFNMFCSEKPKGALATFLSLV
jgi:hypothetical protein